jgi:hypothetical protein
MPGPTPSLLLAPSRARLQEKACLPLLTEHFRSFFEDIIRGTFSAYALVFVRMAERPGRQRAVPSIGSHVARHYMCFDADRAKLLMPVECLVCFTVALSQNLNLLHFHVVSLRPGKKFEQTLFENIICLDCLY